MSADYLDFITRKCATLTAAGIEDPGPLPAALKPFQRDIVRCQLRRGRSATFAGTGLGKTLMQLSWADAVERNTDAPVLLLAPLAVSSQTIEEAAKFGIGGVVYAADQSEAHGRIVVTNYERAERFDPAKFSGVALDESSIIKAHASKTRTQLIAQWRETPYRSCNTATPAPNDFTELGNHAEFLGVMTEKEMLAMYFVHDGSVRAGDAANSSGWRLKRHAEQDFWRWVCTWAVLIRHPRDLGYDEPGYDLPPLHKHQITVPTGGAIAKTLRERIAARRDSVGLRVQAAVDLVRAKPHEPWLIWCGLNTEADMMAEALRDLGAEQVAGKDKPQIKSDRLLGFCIDLPPILITKPKIAGFGMNWQHCANMVFVGMNDSFEQLYQAIRRCLRFGQLRDVNAYLIAADTEGAVVANIDAKERAFEAMAEAMAGYTREFVRESISPRRDPLDIYQPQQRMVIPAWLTAA